MIIRLLRRLLLLLSLGLAQALRVGPAASLAQLVLDRTSVQLHSAKLQSLRSGRALPQGLLQIYVEVEATIDTPPIGGGQSGPASFTVSSADINVEFEGESVGQLRSTPLKIAGGGRMRATLRGVLSVDPRQAAALRRLSVAAVYRDVLQVQIWAVVTVQLRGEDYGCSKESGAVAALAFLGKTTSCGGIGTLSIPGIRLAKSLSLRGGRGFGISLREPPSVLGLRLNALREGGAFPLLRRVVRSVSPLVGLRSHQFEVELAVENNSSFGIGGLGDLTASVLLHAGKHPVPPPHAAPRVPVSEAPAAAGDPASEDPAVLLGRVRSRVAHFLPEASRLLPEVPRLQVPRLQVPRLQVPRLRLPSWRAPLGFVRSEAEAEAGVGAGAEAGAEAPSVRHSSRVPLRAAVAPPTGDVPPPTAAEVGVPFVRARLSDVSLPRGRSRLVARAVIESPDNAAEAIALERAISSYLHGEPLSLVAVVTSSSTPFYNAAARGLILRADLPGLIVSTEIVYELCLLALVVLLLLTLLVLLRRVRARGKTAAAAPAGDGAMV